MTVTTEQIACYSIEALLAEGFSRRQLYRLTASGILPYAYGRGRAAYYTDTHLRILRAIKEAQDQRVTPADIAERYNRTFKGWHRQLAQPDAV